MALAISVVIALSAMRFLIVLVPPVKHMHIFDQIEGACAKALLIEQDREIEQGILLRRTLVGIRMYECPVGLKKCLQRKAHHILDTRSPGGTPDAFEGGKQMTDDEVRLFGRRDLCGIKGIDPGNRPLLMQINKDDLLFSFWREET